MADRKTPDFRNSIKESISAVEALCIVITDDSKTTLGQALTIIEKVHKIHPALKKSFTSLYGFTSDSSGIRHALIDQDNLTQGPGHAISALAIRSRKLRHAPGNAVGKGHSTVFHGQ
jgi:hypothetical protein